jgi:superfamily I DNA/RNA helicase
MRVLSTVKPTSEQLPLIQNYSAGTLVVRGAAGSGKTTTALLRLKFVTRYWEERVRDGHVQGPVRALVLTYNRTLRGYIEALAESQVSTEAVDLDVSTFGRWSYNSADTAGFDPDKASRRLRQLATRIPLDREFLVSEADYALSRFLPEDIETYLEVIRQGRGRSPQMDKDMRRRLLDEVLEPYSDWKSETGVQDWNDLAVEMAVQQNTDPYHVVVVDEAQDFSANQARGVINHLAEQHSATWVMDAAQRIYPRHFTWREVGLDVGPKNSRRLAKNHRNTRQIAAFAMPLLSTVELTDDGTTPDFESCDEDGPPPVVIRGRFSGQMDFLIQALERILPSKEAVAVMHAQGGGWFSEVRKRLTEAGIVYEDISGQSDWPAEDVDVVLSTMHSAKGLEFDHVFIVGLNQEVTPHGADPGDSILENYLRLLAMAVGRARKSATIGFKPEEASTLTTYMEPGTFVEVDV